MPIIFAVRCFCLEQKFASAFCAVAVLYISCVCVSSVSGNVYAGGDEKQEIKLGWIQYRSFRSFHSITLFKAKTLGYSLFDRKHKSLIFITQPKPKDLDVGSLTLNMNITLNTFPY